MTRLDIYIGILHWSHGGNKLREREREREKEREKEVIGDDEVRHLHWYTTLLILR